MGFKAAVIAGVKRFFSVVASTHKDQTGQWSWLRLISSIIVAVILGILIWKNHHAQGFVDLPENCKEILFAVLFGKALQKWVEVHGLPALFGKGAEQT